MDQRLGTPGARRAPAAGQAAIMAGLSLLMLLSSLGTSIAGITLPELVRVFGASYGEVQWVVTAYLAANTSLLVVAGRLGDRIGRRRLLLAGIAVFTAASVLCALASTLAALIALRAMQGLGAAIMMSLSMALAGDSVPRERTGAAMGFLGMMSAVGTTLGPSLGGVLVSSGGWRAVHWFHLPLGVLALLLACRRSVTGNADRGVRTEPEESARLLRAGLVRGTSAASRTLLSGAVTSFLVSAVVMTTLVVGPFHLQRALGLSAALAGMVMSAGPLAAALASVPAGRLVDRSGAGRGMTAGLAVMAIASGLLALLPERSGAAGYGVPLAALTVGYALFQAANNTLVMTTADPARRGVVSGVLSFSRNLGLIAGTSVMGAVFALAVGAEDLATAAGADVAHGMRVVFAAATALILVAGAVAVRRRP